MSKDIQLGKDQIENYQNGDIDRPYNDISKEKEASFVSYKKIMEENRVLRDDLIQSRIKQQQLKAENARMKKLLKEIIEIAEDHYYSMGSDGSYGAITGIAKKALKEGISND